MGVFSLLYSVPFHQMNGDQSGTQLTPAQATALKAAQMHRQPMFSDSLFNTTQQQLPSSTPQPMPMVSQSQTVNVASPQVPVQPQQSKPAMQPESPAKKPSPAHSQSGQSQGKAPPMSPEKSFSKDSEQALPKSPCSSGKGTVPPSPKRPNIGKAEPAEKQLPSSPSTPQSQPQDKKPVGFCCSLFFTQFF